MSKLDKYLDIGTGADFDSAGSSSASLDEAVSVMIGSRDSDMKKPGEATKDEEAEVKVKDDGWADEPTYNDQYAKYPEHCRPLGPYFKQFDVASQEEDLQKFMDRQYPLEAPDIIVKTTSPQFGQESEGWKVLVTYYKVQYRRLLDKGTK